MIYSEQTSDGILVKIEDRLDTNTSPELRKVIREIPDNTECLTIDLGNTYYVSSAGLRELLIARRRFPQNHMKIISVNDFVMQIFQTTGFDTILPIESGNHANFVHLSIRDFIRRKSASSGDTTVIRDNNKDWTWREIDFGSDAMASRLYKMGIRKGTHVGIVGLNSINFILCFYAIQKLGALSILINYSLKPTEIRNHIEASDVSYMCIGNLSYGTDKESISQELLKDANGLKDIFFFEDIPDDVLVDSEFVHMSQFSTNDVEADDPCIMIFTSGSTGRPKGVILSAYNVLNAADISRRSQHLTNASISCNILPLFHIFGLVAGLFASAFANALLVLPKDMHVSTLLDTIETNRCTVFHSVPTMFLAIITSKDFNPERLSTLRCTILSGAPATQTQLNLFRENFPKNHFLSSYGLSEMAPVTITDYEDTPEHITDTVGKPMEHIELKIADLSDGHKCAIGETGEILIQGYNLMAGYYKTAIDNQSIDADGWLHTGDLGYLRKDGYLHLDGRLKELIIRGGENIMPLDVAQAVSMIPGVKDVKVVGVPSDFYGEEVAACICLKDSSDFDENEARVLLSKKLANFKIPSYFLIFNEFPTLSNGKIDSISILEEAKRRVACVQRK